MTDQCAILQNQRLSSPPVAAALCPTMDLVALTAKDASLSVYVSLVLHKVCLGVLVGEI